MATVYELDKTFKPADLAKKPLERGEYEGCVFEQLDLSGFNLSMFQFTDCIFRGCNLSLAQLGATVFQDVRFEDCKMLGLHFYDCNERMLSVNFSKCMLNDSSFYKLRLRSVKFGGCLLHGVDFTATDLTQAVFADADLKDAKFDNSILEKADLRTSVNFSIDPTINKLKKAKFSRDSLEGLLHRFDILVS